MLHEYAVDPACLKEWETFRNLLEKFGIPYGRLISRFPKDWMRIVDETCNSFTFLQRRMMAEELTRIKKQALIRSGRLYDGNKLWKENAVEQHSNKPFHAIITDTKEGEQDFVLNVKDITENTLAYTPSLWQVERNKKSKILRTAGELSLAIAPLLRMSKRILFIDPFFEPASDRWQKPLRLCIESAIENREKCPAFEYHLKNDNSESKEKFEKRCNDYLADVIPVGAELKLFRWDDRRQDGGEGWHARYVLTERGGIRIDWGLDEGKRDTFKTDIALLDQYSWQEYWDIYQEDSDTFNLVDTISVVGNG